MHINLKRFLISGKKIVKGWSDDNATTMSAALAYYAVFSIGPLVFISIALTGLFFGANTTRGEVFLQINYLVGPEAAGAIKSIVDASLLKRSSVLATVIGSMILIMGASSIFSQLQYTLNQIWKVKTKRGSGLKVMLRQRLLSFVLILVVALLLLGSLIASAIFSNASSFTKVHLPGGRFFWESVNTLLSFSGSTILFASIFKILPEVNLTWKNVWIGGMLTASLFTAGKLLIGFYLGHSNVVSLYGAAGAIVLILLWTYYSSAILILGAEYTRFRMTRDRVKPTVKKGATMLLSHRNHR